MVIVRKDAPASYHLAATLDDAADGVTLVTRGADLFPATHIHRLLQALLTTLVLIPLDLAGGAMKEKLLTRMERWDTKALWACAAFPP